MIVERLLRAETLLEIWSMDKTEIPMEASPHCSSRLAVVPYSFEMTGSGASSFSIAWSIVRFIVATTADTSRLSTLPTSSTESAQIGRLEKLEEIDYEGGVKVEVAISAQIVKLLTDATRRT
jgi:hypothetical protein